MTKKRIYAVTTSHAKPITRLVRADSAAQAFRHVAGEIITAELASQDDLIDATKAGITVEEAGPEQRKEITSAANDGNGLETKEPLKEIIECGPILELPAHMDRRPKAVVG